MIQIKEIYIRWIGIPVLAFLMKYIMPHESHMNFWAEYLISILFTAFYWNFMLLIFRIYRKAFPEIQKYGKRLILTVGTMVLLILIANPLIRLAIGEISFVDLMNPDEMFQFIPQIILVTIMVSSFYETAYFFEKYRESTKNYTDLKSQQLKTQFEVLQNQMSPHFLFNSLNTLSTLISEDSALAEKFTEKLSDVYRYILQNKEKEVVRVREEIEFVNSYLFLLQMRYPENLHIKISLDESVLDKFIPPLTLQILVENAVKHNTISANYPLKIDIYSNEGKTILVKNNLRIKSTLQKSTKTGLENLQKRYQLLNQKEIEIIRTSQNFIVAVPLIHIQHEETLFEKAHY